MMLFSKFICFFGNLRLEFFINLDGICYGQSNTARCHRGTGNRVDLSTVCFDGKFVFERHPLELGSKGGVRFGQRTDTGGFLMGGNAEALDCIISKVDPDHYPDIAAEAFAGTLKRYCFSFAVENADKKTVFGIAVFELEAVDDRIIGCTVEDRSDGRAFDENKLLVFDFFLLCCLLEQPAVPLKRS